LGDLLDNVFWEIEQFRYLGPGRFAVGFGGIFPRSHHTRNSTI
jgi:hypothetical protein